MFRSIWKQAVHFFGDVKASEQAIKTLLRDDPHHAALRKLADGLRAILPHLHVLLCGDDGPSPSLDLHTIHILCMGLSTCVAPAMGAMFDKKRLQQLKPHLQAITNVLTERACEAGLQSATASIGIVLDILNWASRALKADCIDVSSSIEKVFDAALDVFEDALAGKTGPCGLTPHQIGKCAVQISTIFKFSLIRLDNSEQGLAGCRRLTACGKRLCSAEIAARLGAGKIDAVVCTNISRTLGRKSSWAIAIGTAQASSKTRPRPSSGIARLQTRGCPRRNSSWTIAIGTAQRMLRTKGSLGPK
jgi:hypothetical protein